MKWPSTESMLLLSNQDLSPIKETQRAGLDVSSWDVFACSLFACLLLRRSINQVKWTMFLKNICCGMFESHWIFFSLVTRWTQVYLEKIHWSLQFLRCVFLFCRLSAFLFSLICWCSLFRKAINSSMCIKQWLTKTLSVMS